MTYDGVKSIRKVECCSQLKPDPDAWIEDWTNNSDARNLDNVLATTMAWKYGSKTRT